MLHHMKCNRLSNLHSFCNFLKVCDVRLDGIHVILEVVLFTEID